MNSETVETYLDRFKAVSEAELNLLAAMARPSVSGEYTSAEAETLKMLSAVFMYLAELKRETEGVCEHV